MIVRLAMLEAVVAVASITMHARNERCIDEGFAGRGGALLFVGQDVRFLRGTWGT